MAVGRPPAAWNLVDFFVLLDVWAATEDPGHELRITVLAWIQSLMDNPYRGVQQTRDHPDLWFAKIPGTHRAGTMVTCTFKIDPSTRSVLCKGIATLNLPI